MARTKKTVETNTEETKIETPLTIAIEFLWLEAKPDNRQYRQNSIILNPSGVNVAVEIPLKPEYLHNSAEIIKFQLDQGGTPLPVLTPKGLRYCLDQLDTEFSDNNAKQDNSINDENLEWEDTPEDTKTATENIDETEWSDEDDTTDDTDDLKETDFQWE